MNVAYNVDCMEYMRNLPNKFFDLAVVDPPYGGGSQTVHVERERERESCKAVTPTGKAKSAAVLGDCLTSTISVNRTGGEMVKKIPSAKRGYL